MRCLSTARARAASVNDYLGAHAHTLTTQAADDVHGDKFAGRLLDFFNWATGDTDLLGDAMRAWALVGFLTSFPDPKSALLGIVNVQAVANQQAVVSGSSDTKDRGFPFLGDLLSGFLDTLQGTAATGRSDRTDIGYKVGAIGWPDGGIPGRGLEITFDPSHALAFLQTQLLNDLLAPSMSKPLVGYISVRVCPKTETVMGMQQFDPSVMIEIVGYRSPEANDVMDAIQQRVLDLNRTQGLQAALHWGLENQKMTAADLAHTPWNDPYGSFPSRIEAFKAVRAFFTAGHPPAFDNVFTARLGL